jgi:tellurite resistance protein
VLDALVELDVAPDLVASLALVPLVEVAWADGHVDPRERDAILAGAVKTGVARKSVDYTLLEEWLKHRPPAKLMKAWTHYVEGLCEALDEAGRLALQHDLLDRARAVAEAAGGFLGLTSKVSAAEQDVLAKLERAFTRHGHRRSGAPRPGPGE